MRNTAIRKVRRNRGVLLLLAALVMSMSGCVGESERPCYSHFADMGGGGWYRDAVLEFDPMPADSVNNPGDRYDMVLCLRHSGKLNIDTLWVVMSSWSLEDTAMRNDTLPIVVSDTSGHFTGSGQRGLYTLEQPISRGITLPEEYHVMVSHAMQDDPIDGVNSVGILMYRRLR